TIDTTIDQQVAMDEALVPHAKRLRIGRSNFCMLSDIKSKESTLQLEFWAIATVHHHSIWFKMDNKKHIVNMESFREMLHICPRLPHQPFVKPPFEEEILAFLRFLGYSGVIRKLIDVNINKLHQPWRSFAAIINKCLTEKSSAMTAYSYLKLKFTKASKAKSLSALSEVAMTEAQQLKLVTKRSLQQTYISQASGFGADEGTSSIPEVPDVPTDESEEELSWNFTDEEGDDDKGKDGDGDDGEEGDGDDDDEDDNESDEEEFIHPSLRTHIEEEPRDEESFDHILKTPEDTDDEGNGKENLGLNVGREEGHDKEEEEDKLDRDVNINQGRGIQMTQEVKDSYVTLTLVNPDGQQESLSVSSQFMTSMLNPTLDVGMEFIFETTSQMDAQTPTLVAPLLMSAPTLTSSTIPTITTTKQEPLPPTTAPNTLLQDLPNSGSLLREEAQKENEEFLKTLDENMQKIIKEQVKVQVSKILPRIEQTVNEQLEAEVLTRSSNSSKTSYAVASYLSEMELKKILIEKMEGNKSIHQSNKQRNIYKALVEAYESDKIILDTYRDTITLKRRRDDDADKDEEPFAGPDQGFKRRREGKEPDLASAPTKTATRSTGRPPLRWKNPYILSLKQQSDSRSSFNELMDTPVDFFNFLINRLNVNTLTPKLLAGPTYELLKGSCKSLAELEYLLDEVYKATTDQLDWVNLEGQQNPHNLFKPLPLIPNNRGHRVIPFDHFINNDLEYLRRGSSSRKYTTSVTKTKAADYGHIKWIEDLVPRIMWIQEPIGYDKHALWESPIGGVNNKDKKNRLMRIDELHKFNDGMLTDVRTALNDRLKGIRMQYPLQSIWRKSDKDRAAAMIQAIDKRLKIRRIMRSLKRSNSYNWYLGEKGDFTSIL
nr:hypothetical protein [Tanacetum cinerariifolium]